MANMKRVLATGVNGYRITLPVKVEAANV